MEFDMDIAEIVVQGRVLYEPASARSCEEG